MIQFHTRSSPDTSSDESRPKANSAYLDFKGADIGTNGIEVDRLASHAEQCAMAYSVIINTFERPASLSRTLETLARQKGIGEVEIIVVDDGSETDQSAIDRQWKKKLNFRYMKIRHAGRGGARNRGVKAASGDRVIFLGDDILVRPGWLERHIETGRERPETAIIGPNPLQLQKPKIADCSPAFLRWADPIDFNAIKDPNNAGFLYFTTGNLSMDRAMFLDLGGFDENFKSYGWEDIDLGYRFHHAGGKIVFDPAARAIHAHPHLTRADLWAREYAVGLTAYQFWMKHQAQDLVFMKFWSEDSRGGPRWHRRLGAFVIDLVEKVAPRAPFLPSFYERMIYSCRFAGVDEARRVFGGGGPASNPKDASSRPD